MNRKDHPALYANVQHIVTQAMIWAQLNPETQRGADFDDMPPMDAPELLPRGSCVSGTRYGSSSPTYTAR